MKLTENPGTSLQNLNVDDKEHCEQHGSPRALRHRRRSASLETKCDNSKIQDASKCAKSRNSSASPSKRELRKLEDCWNVASPSKELERCLRSGLRLESKQEDGVNDNVVNQTEHSANKSNDEKGDINSEDKRDSTENDAQQTFPRRKKLRSEVSKDELWEGFIDIRFKRLTPIKNRKETFRVESNRKIANEVHIWFHS